MNIIVHEMVFWLQNDVKREYIELKNIDEMAYFCIQI